MDNSSSLSYRSALGFYPTAKDPSEIALYQNVNNRVKYFLKDRGINAGNVRNYHHDLAVYSFEESQALFDYARRYPHFKNLLPSAPSCQSFIFSVLLASIAEEDKIYHSNQGKTRGSKRKAV